MVDIKEGIRCGECGYIGDNLKPVLVCGNCDMSYEDEEDALECCNTPKESERNG